MKSLAKFLIPAVLLAAALLVIVELSREPVRPTLVPEMAGGGAPKMQKSDGMPEAQEPGGALEVQEPDGVPEIHDATPTPAPPAGSPLPISKLRMPLEFYESGAVKSQIEADFADVPDEGNIQASNVLARTFAPDGSVRVLLALESCVVDREESIVSSDTGIRLERDDLVITGRGFEWFMDEEKVKINDETKVVLKRSLKSRWKLGAQ